MSTPDGSSRRVRLILPVAVVAATLVAFWALGGGTSEATSTPGASTVSPSSSQPGADPSTGQAAPEPSSTAGASSEAPADADEPTPTTGPDGRAGVTTGLDASAAPTQGVTASLSGIEAVTGEAMTPGEIGGPALRITVEIANGTSQDLDLGSAVVTLTYGADAIPAPPLGEPGGQPFPATVASGQTATSVVLFTVPADSRNDITVSVDLGIGTVVTAFRGSAPAASEPRRP